MIVPLKLDYQDLKSGIMANSASLAIGDMLVPGTGASSALLSQATSTSALLLGNTIAIEGKAGAVLELDSVTVASDNVTVAQTQAVYLPAYVPMEYICDIDAAAGTTTGSGGVGFFTLVSGDGGLLDESTWVAYSGTASHFMSFGVTPQSTTKVFAHPYLAL